MENTNFNHLLDRYLQGKLTEPERVKFEAWLEVRKKENMTDLELSKDDEEKLYQKITNKLDSVEDVVAFRPEHNDLRLLISNRWLQIAASLLIVFVASFAIYYRMNSKATYIETIAASELEKVILNDGTIVWLHKHSKLTYYQNTEGGSRQADLQGEALFEVTKDPNRPFSISCGDITVKVLGTSFSLKTNEESIELKVLTGKVNLSSVVDYKGVDIIPNEKAIYNRNGQVQKINLSNDEIITITARTQYNMQFQNTTMENVFAKIEKKFDVKIAVGNKQLTKCRVTGDFTDKSLERTFQMLSELLDLDYSISGRAVTIEGKGCN